MWNDLLINVWLQLVRTQILLIFPLFRLFTLTENELSIALSKRTENFGNSRDIIILRTDETDGTFKRILSKNTNTFQMLVNFGKVRILGTPSLIQFPKIDFELKVVL